MTAEGAPYLQGTRIRRRWMSGAPACDRREASRTRGGRRGRELSGYAQLFDFRRLLEMLVGGAVVAPRQRLALARGALAGAGVARARLPVQADVIGQALEELAREVDVAL